MIAEERTERIERTVGRERDGAEEICYGCFGAAAYDCRDCTRVRVNREFRSGSAGDPRRKRGLPL